jgi:hypothetical protein
MSDAMEKLIEAYPYLKGRENKDVTPKHKIVVRMLDRHLITALNGKLGIKPDRKEELTVTFHTSGQEVLWTVPIISVLEDEKILADMDQKEVEQLRFIYTYDNWLE